MANDGSWGDHVVLYAAANHFQTPIRIISSLDREIVVHPDHALANSSPLVLGHINELHYDSLQPRQGKTFFSITNILVFWTCGSYVCGIYIHISVANVSMTMKYNFFLNNKLSLLNLKIILVV